MKHTERLSSRLRLIYLPIACSVLMMGTSLALAGQSDWLMSGVDTNNSRYQPNTTIDSTNVANLAQRWAFTDVDMGDVSATPAVVGNKVYFPVFPKTDGAKGYFYAVDSKSGALIWKSSVESWTGVTNDWARTSPAVDGNRLFLGDQGGQLGAGAYVISVDSRTGALLWRTQVETHPTGIVTSSPVVNNGVVYVGVASAEENFAVADGYPCCSFRGSVVALDEVRGNILWKTYTISDPGFSGAAVWGSTPVIDVKRNSIIVATGNNYSVPEVVKNCVLTAGTSDPVARATCIPGTAKDYFNAVISMDLTTGQIKWAKPGLAFAYDPWNVSCIVAGFPGASGVNCPRPLPPGPDYDFGGAGPNLIKGRAADPDMVGVGSKSGVYFALNPDNGNLLWSTAVGPGSTLGGIEWGTATDGNRIYAPNSNFARLPWPSSSGPATGGSWSALDKRTGAILWQTATPGPGLNPALGPGSLGKDVFYVGSMDSTSGDNTMFALNAATGAILWRFPAGSEVNAAPAITEDAIFWGSGYKRFGLGIGNNKLYAFSIGGR